MTPNTLDFKCAVVTGGGGGIGRAMSEHFISLGKKVIIVGRTESNLKSAAQELGHNTTYYVLDTGNIEAIPAFVEKVTKDHPEVDCLVNNAGVQRPLDINNFDLGKADQEININIRGPMYLAMGFLPHFKSKSGGGVIVNVSSVLGYNPFSIANPVYNGTKAWVHFFTMNMRTQLKGANIKVVEIAPPTVSTALHRDRANPDDNKKENNPNALSVEEFMEFVAKGLRGNAETIGAGPSEKIVQSWFDTFGEAYGKADANFK